MSKKFDHKHWSISADRVQLSILHEFDEKVSKMKKEIFRTLGHESMVKKKSSGFEFECNKISNRWKEKQ